MQMPSFRLDGKVIIITGAASGIGAGLARGVAHFGAAVACVDVSADGLRQTVADIEDSGGRAVAISADVREEGSLAAAVNQVEKDLGPLVAPALSKAG